MGFEQLKYSPPQPVQARNNNHRAGKHKLISHQKQEDKKLRRSCQFTSSADYLVIYVFAIHPILMFRKSL